MKNLQKYIFTLLLIFLPTQLGWHFWPEWSYVSGVRIDYLSPTLYATDLLILLLVLLEIYALVRRFSTFRRNDNLQFTIFNKFTIKQFLKILPFLLFISLNIYFSLSLAVSAYKWVRVAEMGFLVWFVARRVKLDIRWLLIPIFYESVLAIWQFWAQSSVGGLWYWLGERGFNSDTPGIANAYLNGSLVLRPYGTFPHPNVLGGFLAVVLPLILWQFLHNSRKLTARALARLLVVVLGYAALFLSMSRVAILVGIGATLVVLWQKLGSGKIWLGILGGLGLLGMVLWPRFAAIGTETQPLVARAQLANLTIKQFARSPIWGTGLGTNPIFAFQPVHNIYLLILAETGILGALGVLGALRRIKFTPPLITVLILGLFDHYFLTLQQGQLILSLILGLSLVRMNKEKIERR